MASLSLPVVHAVAVEVVEQVDTPASVLTGVPVALVHIWKRSKRVSAWCLRVAGDFSNSSHINMFLDGPGAGE